MDPLRPEIRSFLSRVYPFRTVARLAGDASTRSFYRVHGEDGGSRVVMDYGAPFEGESDDEVLSRVFLRAGLPVARVLASSPADGCLLLEDLGDLTLETELLSSTGPDDRRPWLERAARLAARMAGPGSAALAESSRRDGPALDPARFRYEMDFFLRHVPPALSLGDTPPAPLGDALADLAERAAGSPRIVLCHRDFHSRNLMVLEDRSLAMVDIQDARWGPDSYDLASLLCDAYIEVDEAWIEPLIAVYLGSLADPPDRGAFRERFHVVAAQRMIKALGTFGYQASVLGRDRYRDSARRTTRRLRAWLPAGETTRELGRRLDDAGLLDEDRWAVAAR